MDVSICFTAHCAIKVILIDNSIQPVNYFMYVSYVWYFSLLKISHSKRIIFRKDLAFQTIVPKENFW